MHKDMLLESYMEEHKHLIHIDFRRIKELNSIEKVVYPLIFYTLFSLCEVVKKIRRCLDDK